MCFYSIKSMVVIEIRGYILRDDLNDLKCMLTVKRDKGITGYLFDVIEKTDFVLFHNGGEEVARGFVSSAFIRLLYRKAFKCTIFQGYTYGLRNIQCFTMHCG